jgi:hypothetical protein
MGTVALLMSVMTSTLIFNFEINIFLFGAPNIPNNISISIVSTSSLQWCNIYLLFEIILFRVKFNISIKRAIFYSHLQSNIYVVMIKFWIYIAGFIVMI